jgi:hypothetical protein
MKLPVSTDVDQSQTARNTQHTDRSEGAAVDSTVLLFLLDPILVAVASYRC